MNEALVKVAIMNALKFALASKKTEPKIKRLLERAKLINGDSIVITELGSCTGELKSGFMPFTGDLFSKQAVMVTFKNEDGTVGSIIIL